MLVPACRQAGAKGRLVFLWRNYKFRQETEKRQNKIRISRSRLAGRFHSNSQYYLGAHFLARSVRPYRNSSVGSRIIASS
jgi:hypothetical protein